MKEIIVLIMVLILVLSIGSIIFWRIRKENKNMGHDLDDEELRATRKLLGLEKKDNFISTDELIKSYEDLKANKNIIKCIEKDFFFNFMDRIIGEYNRQKQINEEHRKINGELREKENKTFSLGEIEVNLALYIKENYIPKQNVFKKINYYNDNIKHSQFIKDKEAEDFYYDLKRAFEKLLKESEENNIKKISEELREIILKLEEGR